MQRESLSTPPFRWVTSIRDHPTLLLIWILPTVWLELISFLSGTLFDPVKTTGRVLFTLAVLALSCWAAASSRISRKVLIVCAGLISGLAAGWLNSRGIPASTLAVWPSLVAYYAVLLIGINHLTVNRARWIRWLLMGTGALYSAVLPVALAQLETRFSEEEFFVALQAAALIVFWVLLWTAFSLSIKKFSFEDANNNKEITAKNGHSRASYLIGLIVITGTLLFGWIVIRSYQNSFYTPSAPGFAGISPDRPFICASLPESDQNPEYTAEAAFQTLQELVEAHPRKGPSEYGLLAISRRDPVYAAEFRRSLLAEAEQGKYTGPSNSIKFGQYEAALRLYFYSQVKEFFPDLFDAQDEEILQQWFAAINRRALTSEWVDWLYALAFNKIPEGPYENQENGAGLLALLEVTGMADPNLSSQNRAYLDQNVRGWETRFKNTDDALIYQPEWIYNALFQSQYRGGSSPDNQKLSFYWILAQALPTGAPFGYNHPAPVNLTGIAALGARLLQDSNLAWLAAQAANYSANSHGYIAAVPGAEKPFAVDPESPDLGSCLLFSDSGLPNQVGPLAPDKIVFRDGWQVDDKYLMLNLRFTGWHRYKATNTITLVYQGEPLAGDHASGQAFSWLPSGRSLFRDKRIPRENLNGIVVPRSGFDAALNILTGVGSPWAQDPPAYAEVVEFATGSEYDISTTRITGWNGWEHTRTILFYHRGPIVIIDTAQGPKGSRAGLTWNTFGQIVDQTHGDRVQLRDGSEKTELVVVPLNGEGMSISHEENGLRLLYQSEKTGHLEAVSLFLTGEWWGSEISLLNDGNTLRLLQQGKELSIPLQ